MIILGFTQNHIKTFGLVINVLLVCLSHNPDKEKFVVYPVHLYSELSLYLDCTALESLRRNPQPPAEKKVLQIKILHFR